ncbi:hypothetical protein AV530_007743 [Patagioenas fasciata monilis]|uniref:Uncharacterized protein n=1 Tax=Patagioenas fasciata monilis TaxID=372326 RepID=A0A1V4JYY2_PATFA|nr:hypothetical protein AV530_007743 [Patagioenas fasciata monilis]
MCRVELLKVLPASASAVPPHNFQGSEGQITPLTSNFHSNNTDYTRNLSLQSQICCFALGADECKAEIFPKNLEEKLKSLQ